MSPSGENRKATLFPGPKITDHLTKVPSRCAHLQLTDGAFGSSQTASAITVSIKTISVPLIRTKMWNRRDNYPCEKDAMMRHLESCVAFKEQRAGDAGYVLDVGVQTGGAG